MTTHVRDGGVWKVVRMIYVRDAGVWKAVAGAASKIRHISSLSDTRGNAISFTGHQAGDLIIATADKSTAGAPAFPAGWTEIASARGGLFRVAYIIAPSTATITLPATANVRWTGVTLRGSAGIGVFDVYTDTNATNSQTIVPRLQGQQSNSLIIFVLSDNGFNYNNIAGFTMLGGSSAWYTLVGASNEDNALVLSPLTGATQAADVVAFEVLSS